MTPIRFYRGQKANYSTSTHGSGIYFAYDTKEIIHNGVSYGLSDIDAENYATKEFVRESIKGFVGYSIYDTGNNKIVFSDKQKNELFSVTLPVVDTTTDGLMSQYDKSKLNSIEHGAQINKINSIDIDLGDVYIDGTTAKINIADAVQELIKSKSNEDFSEVNQKIADLQEYDGIVENRFTADDDVEGSVRNLANQEAKELLTWNE